jgi:hypothetical protein
MQKQFYKMNIDLYAMVWSPWPFKCQSIDDDKHITLQCTGFKF